MKYKKSSAVLVPIVLGSILVLMVSFLSACRDNRITLPQGLDELSLSKTWNTVAQDMGIQKDTVELESFRLITGPEGKIDVLDYIFHDTANAEPKAYQAVVNSEGNLSWNTYRNTMPKTRRPAEIFTEIDKVRLSPLKPDNVGLLLQVDFQFTSTHEYTNDNLNIYELKDGQILPLKKVLFQFTPVVTISIRLDDPAANQREKLVQTWFLNEDVSRAKTVEYTVAR